MTHTTTNNKELEATLLRKEAELVRVLRQRGGIEIQKSADPMDESQLASERELEVRIVDRESASLREVRAALERIHDGSYGVCILCDGEISPKRLAAVPSALRCISCQEIADQMSSPVDNPMFAGVSSAA